MIVKSRAYLLGKKACEENLYISHTEDLELVKMIKASINKRAEYVNDWDRGWKLMAKRLDT